MADVEALKRARMLYDISIPHPFPYQGGKRGIVRFILPYFPNDVERLVEPFCGSELFHTSPLHAQPHLPQQPTHRTVTQLYPNRLAINSRTIPAVHSANGNCNGFFPTTVS